MRRRKQIRLKEYDYSQPGAYFITICTKDRMTLFGKIVGGDVIMNEYGKIVGSCWNALTDHYDNIALDEFVVMPNHIHGIIIINDNAVGARLPRPYKKITLGNIVGYFKYQSTVRINEIQKTPGCSVWQRGFYEHVIRDENSLNHICEYITTNPVRWQIDRENLNCIDTDAFDQWLADEGKRKLPAV